MMTNITRLCEFTTPKFVLLLVYGQSIFDQKYMHPSIYIYIYIYIYTRCQTFEKALITAIEAGLNPVE